MYICIYVYMYICIYVCMYVCMYTYFALVNHSCSFSNQSVVLELTLLYLDDIAIPFNYRGVFLGPFR